MWPITALPKSRIYPKLEIDSGMEFIDHMMEAASISTSFITKPIFIVIIKLQGFWILHCNYLEWNNSLLLVKNRVKWLQNQGEPKVDGIPPNTTENPKMTSAWKDFTLPLYWPFTARSELVSCTVGIWTWIGWFLKTIIFQF